MNAAHRDSTCLRRMSNPCFLPGSKQAPAAILSQRGSEQVGSPYFTRPRSVQGTAGGKMQAELPPYGAEDNGNMSRKGNAHSFGVPFS